MINYCETCSMRDKIQNVCYLTKLTVNPKEDYCSKHKEELAVCHICGGAILGGGIVEIDNGDQVLQYCNRCNELLNTCQLCERARFCEFETNPDPMPKVVMKTMHQGNMVMQTQVKNEERIKKFCHSCPCWLGDGIDACGKEFNQGCCNQKTSRNS